MESENETNDVSKEDDTSQAINKTEELKEMSQNETNINNLNEDLSIENSSNQVCKQRTDFLHSDETVVKTHSDEKEATHVKTETNNTNNLVNKDSITSIVSSELIAPKRRGRKRRAQIYDKNLDPETLKEKKKKRAVELKLKSLKCTFNENPLEVSGKRQKKAPQRFELQPTVKRVSIVENNRGKGEVLGNIHWINHQLQSANLYNLRLLHRLIYRKQGMFAEKHIRKTVLKFNGFPFDESHPELKRRRDQLEKLNASALNQLSQLLGLRPGTREEMIERIINFLLCPSQKIVEEYVNELMTASPAKRTVKTIENGIPQLVRIMPSPIFPPNLEDDSFIGRQFSLPVKVEPAVDSELVTGPWTKPSFFVEGNGVKLKFIRAVTANIEAASDAFIELLHRLFFMDTDEKENMRRNILEFSGLKCDLGSTEYMYRIRILSILPLEQLKLICRVLCLPTWHRSRHDLTEGIMDFLMVPRISAMKKRVPPLFSEEISFSFDSSKVSKQLPELKSAESEEIEIVPDIHIPDERTDTGGENEYLGVKLKNFSNIHYQVISTPVTKLNDVHMILYLTTTSQNNIRKNILEFSGFPFDESSAEYKCRRTLMEQLSLENLKIVAKVLCVSQYIVDESKSSLIDAILKFLMKPSALLNSSTIMPTITHAPLVRKSSVVKKKATSTIKSPMQPQKKNEIIISSVKSLHETKEETSNEAATCPKSAKEEEEEEEKKPDVEKIILDKIPEPETIVLSKDIQITPVPDIVIKKEVITDTDEPLSDVKKAASVHPSCVSYLESDDDDELPLAKMIGHPNDDQLKALVSKIIKESKLEEITMKHVVKKVFETYPNFDLGYRKEFIKSIVRQRKPSTSNVAVQVCTVNNAERLLGRHFPSFCGNAGKKAAVNRRRCQVCAHTVKGPKKKALSYFECKICNVGLCIDPCFETYHTQEEF